MHIHRDSLRECDRPHSAAYPLRPMNVFDIHAVGTPPLLYLVKATRQKKKYAISRESTVLCDYITLVFHLSSYPNQLPKVSHINVCIA